MDTEIRGAEKKVERISNLDRISAVRIQEDEFGATKLFLLCLAGFILGRLIVFPGFLDPFVPSHDDLYRYFSLSQRIWIYEDWLWPRPLMILFLHLVGILRSPPVIWFILSLTSVAFAAALVLVLQRLGRLRPNIISILLYSTIIFSLPTSFEIYQLDYGGMLAGVLSLAAIYVWCHIYRTSIKKAFSLSLVIYWISLEMKPTFAATMLLLALLQLLFYRDKKTLLLFIGVCCISVLVVLKDRFLGSPFLGSGQGAEIYTVQINLRRNLGALWVYVRSAVTRELLPGMVIAYCLFWHAFNRRWVIIVILLLLAVSSVMPMALIPNRTLALYAWYCGMLLCIPFLYIFQTENAGQYDTPAIPIRVSKVLLPIGLLVTLAALSVSSKLHAPQAHFYYYSISNYNRNVISSLERLSELNTDHGFISSRGILISGIRGPHHPFRNRSYIQDRTHLPDSYVTLLIKSEASWNDTSNNISSMGATIYSNELDIDSFDFYAIYAPDGNLARILTLEDMKEMPEWQRIPTLVCNLNPSLQTWTMNILENFVGCLDEAGESAAVVELVNNVGAVDRTPVLHYYLGHAYQSMGDISSARAEIRVVVSIWREYPFP